MAEPETFSSNSKEALEAPFEAIQEEPDTSLDVLEPNNNTLSPPDQEERPSSPSSSLRSVGSTGSQDEMVLSPVSSLIHQTHHPNVTEIIISTSDTAHPEEAQSPEVSTNMIDDATSSEQVVATPSTYMYMYQFRLSEEETHENYDVSQNEENRSVMEVRSTINHSSSSQNTMSTGDDASCTQPQSTLSLSLKVECTACTCTCTYTKTTLSTGSSITVSTAF